MGPTLNYHKKKPKTNPNQNRFDQGSLALVIFWTSDAELIILWLLTGLSWDQSEAQQPATSTAFHQRMVQSFFSRETVIERNGSVTHKLFWRLAHSLKVRRKQDLILLPFYK